VNPDHFVENGLDEDDAEIERACVPVHREGQYEKDADSVECDNRSVRAEFSFLSVATDILSAFVLADDPLWSALTAKYPGSRYDLCFRFRKVDLPPGVLLF
jgi:hypothetical protein